MEDAQFIYAFFRSVELGMPRLKEIRDLLPIFIQEVLCAVTSAAHSDPYVIYLHCVRELTQEEKESIKEILNPGF